MAQDLAKPACPIGQKLAIGPTMECDNMICRGAMPICEDPTVTVLRCFCKNPALIMDGAKCVKTCPLYP